MGISVAGTFTCIGEPSGAMDADQGSFKLTTVGCDVNNTVKTQKSTSNGTVWTDVTTYNAEQNATVITPAAGEQYRLVAVALQTGPQKQVGYKMTREN